jgi:hypothetical protein
MEREKKMKRFIMPGWIMALSVLVICFILGACDFAPPNNNDDDDKNTKKIPVHFKFMNSEPNGASQNMLSPKRAIVENPDGTFTDEDSFDPFNQMYSRLGNRINSITPDKFQLRVHVLELHGDDEAHIIKLIDGEPETDTGVVPKDEEIDFAHPQSFSPGEVQSGHYNALRIGFGWDNIWDASHPNPGPPAARAEVVFDWPADINFEGHTLGTWQNTGALPGNVKDGKITLETKYLEPGYLNFMFYHNCYGYSRADTIRGRDDILLCAIFGIYGAGSTRRLVMTGFNGVGDIVHADEIVSNFPHTPVLNVLDAGHGKFSRALVLVPWAGIDIPENANKVSFEIRWDLDKIIERYEGKTPDKNDDIFILKNHFWEYFKIKAVIE